MKISGILSFSVIVFIFTGSLSQAEVQPITAIKQWNVNTDLSEAVVDQRDELMSKADEQIRSGLLEFAEKYPQISKVRDFQRTISGQSEKGRISIWPRQTHLGKGATTDQPVPEKEQFSVLVMLQEPPNKSAMGMGPIYPNLGLVGQIHAMAGDPELEVALKKLVDDALKPLTEFNDSFDVSLPSHTKDKRDFSKASLNNLPENALIVRVLDQNIYLKDINPSETQVEKFASDKTPEQLEEWKRQHWRSNLSHYFWVLFEQYAQEKDITVTETDIEQYNQSMLRGIQRQVVNLEKKADSLQKELQAENLDEQKRSELTERLELYTSFANQLNQSQEMFKKPNTPAGTMIRLWKIYNRLYEQYGGRVIFQQAGPEPLDAFRKFLEDQQRQGNFEFFNQEAESLFWEYYRNEKMHTFYSDETEAKAMMQTPWWLRKPEEPLEGDDADLWGEAADGLCMKIRPKKLVFNTEETVTVIVDLLNIGENVFDCSSWEQFFEIEVDGRWYRWGGPEVFDILAFPLNPKKVNYEFAEIAMTEQWESKETAKPLKLDVGHYSLRLRYKPMYVKMDKSDLKPVQAAIAVTSNLVKFKIIPFEQPLSIVLEGQTEITRKVGKWLAKNPRAVKSILGQAYRVRMPSLKPRPDNKITAFPHDPDDNFKIKIMDPSGKRMAPELEEKLTELIQKHIPEEFQKP